jgi:hypothetical protein
MIFSFSVTSDSQADDNFEDITEQDIKWRVNSTIFNRILSEIENQNPKMLFFCGDAFDENADEKAGAINLRYSYWRGMISRLFDKSIYVFPVPGNHEMQEYDKVTGTYKTSLERENAWRINFGDILPDVKRWEKIFGAPFNSSYWSDINYAQMDDVKLQTDQKSLSYSFDYLGSHFIIVNLNAVNFESHAPTARIKEDIFDAKRRGVKHIFIFGHQPAFSYQYKSEMIRRGLDIDIKARDEFWKMINESNATYFCGHEHLFNDSRPGNEKAGQIIVGSAGGEFNKDIPNRNPDLYKYTWVTVKVYKLGRIHIDSYGFNYEDKKIIILKCWDLDKDF